MIQTLLKKKLKLIFQVSILYIVNFLITFKENLN